MQDVEWASRLLASATDKLLICCAKGRSSVKVPLPIIYGDIKYFIYMHAVERDIHVWLVTGVLTLYILSRNQLVIISPVNHQ